MIRSFALAALVLHATLASCDPGDEPAFHFNPVTPAPAGTAFLATVTVSGPEVDVAAIQFTSRVPAAVVAQLQYPLHPYSTLAGWSLDYNSKTEENGDVLLRVLMQPTGPDTLQLSATPTSIVGLTSATRLWTPAGTQLRITLEDAPPDSATGMAGLALAGPLGESYLADTSSDGFLDPDLDRPRGAEVFVEVLEPELYGSDVPSSGWDDFRYYQLLPIVDPVGTKLRFHFDALNHPTIRYFDSSGLDEVSQRTFLGVFLPPFNQAPFLDQGYFPAYPGRVLESTWRVRASSAPTPADALPVEVSLGSSDTNYLTRSIYQETGFPASQGADVPVIPYNEEEFRTLRVLSEVPRHSADGGGPDGPDGLFPMLATSARDGMGTQGAELQVEWHATSRLHLDAYASGTPFSCESGNCDGTVLIPGPAIASAGNPPVEYAFTGQGAEIRLPPGSPPEGVWGGYFTTTPSPVFATLQGEEDSLVRVEVEFQFPDADPDTVPNQILAVFREGSLDYGAVAEYRAFRGPFESLGPNKSLTRVLWLDTQNMPGDYPLTVSIGVAGNAAVTHSQRVVISRIEFSTFTK